MTLDHNLVLASSSPRRIELLKSCRIDFVTTAHRFNEQKVTGRNPTRVAEQIALGKARSIADNVEYQADYVIGVDTIVVFRNKILGKPAGQRQAEENIRLLSGRQHRVISGIALYNREKKIKLVDHAVSSVVFKKFNREFIKFYLDNNCWAGYAGGYAIQGIFSLVIEKIVGSYTNIVGLPMEILYQMFNQVDYKIFK